MIVSIFHKKTQYVELIVTLILSILLIVSVIVVLVKLCGCDIQSEDWFYWPFVIVMIYLFLYGIVEVYACVICVVYDWTTSIVINDKGREISYYNKYTGVIKFNVDDIVEVIRMSKSYPRMIISYVKIILRSGQVILLGNFIDSNSITSLNPRGCRYSHKESIVFEDFLISIMSNSSLKF